MLSIANNDRRILINHGDWDSWSNGLVDDHAAQYECQSSHGCGICIAHDPDSSCHYGLKHKYKYRYQHFTYCAFFHHD
jgi:hypothetical protein